MTRTKREYERTIWNQTKENPKRFWKHIRDNMKTKTGVYPLLESTTDETSLKTEDKEKNNKKYSNNSSAVFLQKNLKESYQHSRRERIKKLR